MDNIKTVVITLAGNRVMKFGPWSASTFAPDYIGNLEELLARLAKSDDPVSAFLKNQFDSDVIALIESHKTSKPISPSERDLLAKGLSRIVLGPPIYSPECFADIPLRPDTRALLDRGVSGKDSRALNRLLLEDAYPELWRNHPWQPNAALCHPSLGQKIDRCEILRESKFAEIGNKISEQILQYSPSTQVRQHAAEFDDPWDFEQVYIAFEDWARNYEFDLEQEQYLVHMVRGTFVQQICLFLLVESKHIPGVLVYNSPPDEVNPLGKARNADLCLAKYDKIASRFNSRRIDAISHLKRGISTSNAQFNEIISEIERVAVNTTDPILLLGPTGAGKSALALTIHQLREERRLVGSNFIVVNCATIRGDGAISALFGHVSGAFTDAKNKRLGCLSAANKGLLFLDEIGELSLEAQTMLLRALDTKKFQPLGSDTEVHSDFQLIAATNQDLDAAVQNGTFRADLLARIDLWTYELPGLRDRPEDIEPNLEYELEQWTTRNGKRVRLNKEVRQKFLAFAKSTNAVWLANFRDLRGIVTRMATLADAGIITSSVLDKEIQRLNRKWQKGKRLDQKELLLHSLLGDEKVKEMSLYDRIVLGSAIEVCRDSKTGAEAGRKFFGRIGEKPKNYSDKTRKFLNEFGLHFSDITQD